VVVVVVVVVLMTVIIGFIPGSLPDTLIAVSVFKTRRIPSK
jgi:hypothetical protein